MSQSMSEPRESLPEGRFIIPEGSKPLARGRGAARRTPREMAPTSGEHPGQGCQQRTFHPQPLAVAATLARVGSGLPICLGANFA